jgi:hypothetical protein
VAVDISASLQEEMGKLGSAIITGLLLGWSYIKKGIKLGVQTSSNGGNALKLKTRRGFLRLGLPF